MSLPLVLDGLIQLGSATANNNARPPFDASILASSDSDYLIVVMMLLAIDIVILLSRPRSSDSHSSGQLIIRQTLGDRQQQQQQFKRKTKDLMVKIGGIQKDFGDLERRLRLEYIREEELELSHIVDSMFKTFVRPKAPLAICAPPSSQGKGPRRWLPSGNKPNTSRPTGVSDAFNHFCERLLSTNRIWQQEKEINKLRADLDAANKMKSSGSFQSLCEKIVLQNKVWQLEKQVRDLERVSAESWKKYENAVSHAAKKMMEDMRKERMVEEYVSGLVSEVDACKSSMDAQAAMHERELQEFTWEWSQEYRNLVRKVEALHLAQRARSIEQEMENDHEELLHENLKNAERRITELEMQIEEFQQALASVSNYDDITINDTESHSITSSFTCVSMEDGYPGTPRKNTPRFSRASMTPRRLRSAQWVKKTLGGQGIPRPKKLSLGSHSGFSFNPLFYGSNPSPLALKPPKRLPSKVVEGVEGGLNDAKVFSSVTLRRHSTASEMRAPPARWRI